MTGNISNPSDYVFSERKELYSEWKNNNDKPAKFKLLTHEKRTGRNTSKHTDGTNCTASVFITIELQPGETKMIPAEYDAAIRRVDNKTNLVVGGLCPWLTKVGEESVTIHSSLDYKSAIAHEAAFNLVKDMKTASELRDALKMLDKKRLDDEAAAHIPEAERIEKKKVGRPASEKE